MRRSLLWIAATLCGTLALVQFAAAQSSPETARYR